MITSVRLKKRYSRVVGKKMPLYFQIINQRVVKQVVLDLEVSEEEWVAKAESINLPPDTNRKRVEQLLHASEEVERHRQLLFDIITLLEEKDDLTTDKIVDCYQAKIRPVSWLDYMQKVIELKKPIRSEATIRNYRSTHAVFSTFLQGKKELLVNGIDDKLLKEFEQDLLARHLSANTISFYLHILQTVWKQAVADGLIEKQPSPFHQVCTHTGKTRKRAVDEDVIKKLENFQPDDPSSGLSLTRDLFLFCYYARGMAFIDLAYLTPENIKGTTLTYTRRKTGQVLVIELLPVMLELIRKYRKKGQMFLFPIFKNNTPTFLDYTSALRLYNKRLKKLGHKIGYTNLSSYVARHSWASVAFKRGITVDVISEGMGHTSVKTTYIYIASLDNTRIDRANKAVIMGKQQYKSIYRSGML